MYLLLEPSPILTQRLAELPRGAARSLWLELEKADRQMQALLQSLAEERLQLAYQHELHMVTTLVCKIWQVDRHLLQSRYRFHRLVMARAQLAAFAREQFGCTQRQLAELLGRERTTVGHTLLVHDNQMATNTQYSTYYNHLKSLYTHASHAAPVQPAV